MHYDNNIGTEKEKVIIQYSDANAPIFLSAKIKRRGGYSMNFNKHSFSLELDKSYPLGNISLDDDWILNASYIDKTLMRHKMSYELFASMNANNLASKCAYVTLALKDQYNGLYILMEELNASNLQISKGDSAAVIFKDPPVFRTVIGKPQDSDNIYQQKYPKILEESKSYLIDMMRDSLEQLSTTDFYAYFLRSFDIDNIIDWHLLLLLSNNSDGILKNFYLYRKDNLSPYRIAVWDYDHSFGRDGDGEYNMMDRPLDCNRSTLFRKLNDIKEYKDQLKTRYKELRSSGIFSASNLNELIDQNLKIIKPHVSANFSKWSVKDEAYYDEKGFDEEVDIIREFVRLRLDQLDQRFSYSTY